MAWRFKASKYKNAAPIVPKPEKCIRDISVGSYQTYGNNIAASAAFMAFNVDHNGSSLAVLPINDYGRKSKTMPLLHAHSDTVTDMDFSNFHDGLLATGSQDCSVKVWHIPEKGLEENLCNPEATFSHRQRRVECVNWHPTVDCLLTTTSFSTLTLWDVINEKEIYSSNGEYGLIQSISWRTNGTSLAAHTKDKILYVVDSRANLVSHWTDSHQSIKDSRVVWLGDGTRILTTGFDSARQREVCIRDLRNLKSPEKTLVLDCSTGILMPLFDPDTSMLFLAGKGDMTINCLEVTEKEPYFVEGIRHTGEQTKGACLVPKRALKVMQAEVNRILQLTSSTVIPITYQVPRKSYRDFHADLYPNTNGCESPLNVTSWMQGLDTQVSKVSLDPAQKHLNTVHRGTLIEIRTKVNEEIEKSSSNKQSIIVDQPKPYRNKNIAAVKNIFEKENNDTNDLKNNKKRFSTEITMKNIENENVFNDNGNNVVDNDSLNVQPPKPLPRISRANSACETTNIIIDDNVAVSIPKPVARPRTNSVQVVSAPFITSISAMGSYKPRLGPKPFTPPKFTDNEETMETKLSNLVLDETSTITEIIKTDKDSANFDVCDKTVNGEKHDEEILEKNEEKIKNEIEDEELDNEGTVDLERGGARASIAERRKMYEVRSQSVQEPANISPVPLRRKDSLKGKQTNKDEDKSTKQSSPTLNAPKRTSTVFGRVSKFRHLKGTPAHKSQHIENVKNVSRQITGECDGFHANGDRVAVPLGGAGGKIAIFELSRTGKLPDGVTPTLVNASNVMDFMWDPFNNNRLAVGCDDGTLKLWLIPDGGLTEPTNTPATTIQCHAEKIYCIKFHPLASDILATTSYDMTTRIWNLITLQMLYTLKGEDQVFGMAWSSCGCYLATIGRNSAICIYEPRNEILKGEPLRQGKGPNRGARIVWGLDSSFIAVTGFDKVSERQIMVFSSDDLSAPLASIGLDVSPAILIPFYDEDSSTLFLTGRGDYTIYAYEMSDEVPHLNPLTHHRCPTLHQGLSFLTKNCCDVMSVEFAKALRLTNTTIEPLSFTVPRIKSDLFQDDLFPETKVTWEPTMTANDWIRNVNKKQPRISLKPPNIDTVSNSQGTPAIISNKFAPTEASNSVQTRVDLWDSQTIKSKQEQLQKAMSNQIEINMNLEQDNMEGVDESEWVR